ncbi:tetratricopeptide repeat protein [Nocardia sp. NPDC051981]|uniref:tetratricopeptide repeat protein n=1 Tax=Nocardia sp. NPDC051981 TaxID=3155417 RepID=UPI00341C9FCF
MKFTIGGSNQIIKDSIIFGTVNQFHGIGGDVSIAPVPDSGFGVSKFLLAETPRNREKARAQPSILLNPQNQIVPFIGRGAETANLQDWIASTESLSVQLIYGPAGQGKTRIARQLAHRQNREGWSVWHVTSQPLSAGSSSVVGDNFRVLAIVDYADRWPASRLINFMIHMRDLTLESERAVRVLLLGRSPGYWWTSVQDFCENNLSISTNQLLLLPIEPGIPRFEIVQEATTAFSTVLEVDVDKVRSKLESLDLDRSEFQNTLTLHMTALAAADAAWRDDDLPADPAAISSYLLRRERTHWHSLHTRQEDPLNTSPVVIARTAYIAAFTDELQRTAARKILALSGLAETTLKADIILDDYVYCYPSMDSSKVLASLHPDRLAEDFVALTIPGHGLAIGWQSDDWSILATSEILTQKDGNSEEGAKENSRALMVLVETALRWPHVAESVLIPVLQEYPYLAIGAGGNILEKILNLDISTDVLEKIDKFIPTSGYSDLDFAAARISTSLMPSRLEAASGQVAKVAIHVNQANRLARIGDRSGALDATSKALEIARSLDAEVEENSRHLAKALLAYGFSLFYMGRYGEAYQAFSEGIAKIQPRLSADGGKIDELAELGKLYTGKTISLAELGKFSEAATSAENAARIHRHLESDTPGYNRFDVAAALANYSNCLRRAGNLKDAVEPIRESVQIYEELAAGGGINESMHLSIAKTDLAALLIDNREYNSALDVVYPAIDSLKRIAETHAYIASSPLASAFSCAAVAEALGKRYRNALDLSAQAIEIYRSLVDVGSGGSAAQLASELSNHASSLASLKLHQEAVEFGVESISIYRWMMDTGYSVVPLNVASAYFNVADAHEKMGEIDLAIAGFHDGWQILDLVPESDRLAILDAASIGLTISRLSLRAKGAPIAGVMSIIEKSAQSYSDYLESHSRDVARTRESIEIKRNLRLLRNRSIESNGEYS